MLEIKLPEMLIRHLFELYSVLVREPTRLVLEHLGLGLLSMSNPMLQILQGLPLTYYPALEFNLGVRWNPSQ